MEAGRDDLACGASSMDDDDRAETVKRLVFDHVTNLSQRQVRESVNHGAPAALPTSSTAY
jgi:hypothetical protein